MIAANKPLRIRQARPRRQSRQRTGRDHDRRGSRTVDSRTSDRRLRFGGRRARVPAGGGREGEAGTAERAERSHLALLINNSSLGRSKAERKLQFGQAYRTLEGAKRYQNIFSGVGRRRSWLRSILIFQETRNLSATSRRGVDGRERGMLESAHMVAAATVQEAATRRLRLESLRRASAQGPERRIEA